VPSNLNETIAFHGRLGFLVFVSGFCQFYLVEGNSSDDQCLGIFLCMKDTEAPKECKNNLVYVAMNFVE